jgi:hypothetical protein
VTLAESLTRLTEPPRYLNHCHCRHCRYFHYPPSPAHLRSTVLWRRCWKAPWHPHQAHRPVTKASSNARPAIISARVVEADCLHEHTCGSRMMPVLPSGPGKPSMSDHLLTKCDTCAHTRALSASFGWQVTSRPCTCYRNMTAWT